MQLDKPTLEMLEISKSFPGVKALDNVSFNLMQGEVHALVGENGAGKSTLMKILCGVYHPDAGQILLDGQPITVSSPRHAQDLGIVIVHQELNLFQNLTITENIFGGNMPSKGWFGFEDRKKAREKAQKFLNKFDFRIHPDIRVSRLSLAQQQIVEISRALVQNARFLILDEPTSSLTDHESELLFKIILQLKAEGLGIIYISHRIEEIFKVGDRVSVLRDGHMVGTIRANETEVDHIIRLMVGRKLEDLYGKAEVAKKDVVLEVRDLSSKDSFEGISFHIRAGEILGLAGLVGSGRTNVGMAIFGARPVTSGQILLNRKPLSIKSPKDAMVKGIAYLSEDRHGDALFDNMGVDRNITISHLQRFTHFGFVSSKQEKQAADSFIRKLNIQTPSVSQKIGKLSGGNQQKVILARWLAIEPRVFIVDEPTRGIDVGAKVEIYMLLHRLAAQGVAIILISSEMQEILGMSDRILVMHEGHVTGELGRHEATEEKIMSLATRQVNSVFMAN